MFLFPRNIGIELTIYEISETDSIGRNGMYENRRIHIVDIFPEIYFREKAEVFVRGGVYSDAINALWKQCNACIYRFYVMSSKKVLSSY